MARFIKVIPSKTYITESTLARAVKDIPDEYRYLICKTAEGRYYPVFIGNNASHMPHRGFCVAS